MSFVTMQQGDGYLLMYEGKQATVDFNQATIPPEWQAKVSLNVDTLVNTVDWTQEMRPQTQSVSTTPAGRLVVSSFLMGNKPAVVISVEPVYPNHKFNLKYQ